MADADNNSICYTFAIIALPSERSGKTGRHARSPVTHAPGVVDTVAAYHLISSYHERLRPMWVDHGRLAACDRGSTPPGGGSRQCWGGTDWRGSRRRPRLCGESRVWWAIMHRTSVPTDRIPTLPFESLMRGHLLTRHAVRCLQSDIAPKHWSVIATPLPSHLSPFPTPSPCLSLFSSPAPPLLSSRNSPSSALPASPPSPALMLQGTPLDDPEPGGAARGPDPAGGVRDGLGTA